MSKAKPHTAPTKKFDRELFNANDPQTRESAKKLLPPKLNGDVFFVVFNTDRTQAGIMTKDSVKKERVVNKFNRLSRLHEDYISVPVEEIIWV
jgi:hypothetical protein